MIPGLVAAGVLAAAASSAQLPAPPAAPTSEPGGAAVPAVYSELFSATSQPGSRAPRFRFRLPQPDTSRDKARSKVVCGMTLIIVDSRPDASMVKPRPKDGVTYPIRRYPPPACGKDEK